MRRVIFPYVLIAPVVLWIAAVILYPAVSGIILGLYSTRQLIPRPEDFVGLRNYARLLQDASMLRALRVTATYTAGTVLGSVLLGMVGALVLNARIPGRAAARALLMVPWALPVVASALVWKWIFDPQYGVFNYALVQLRLLLQPQPWLLSSTLTLPSVIGVDIWSHFPFATVVILTALQSADPNLYDAASVDGASSVQAFRFITLPIILPALLVCVLFQTVWALKRFASIWLLTQGGPGTLTTVLAIKVYREAFVNFDAGYASAIALIGICLATILAIAFLRVAGRDPRFA